MPIMERPNSKAKRIHRQVILHAQKYGEDSESFDVEEISIDEAPDLLKEKKHRPTGGPGALVGFQQGR